jgi:DNA-binding CsgD family transcriptional regulator
MLAVSKLSSWDAGEVDMQKVVMAIVNKPLQEFCCELDRTPRVVGRGDHTDIWIPNPQFSLSRRHAQFWVEKSLMVEDLGSSYGTRVNGVKIPPNHPTQLSISDRIFLGLVEFYFLTEEDYQARLRDEESQSEDSIGSNPILRERNILVQLPEASMETLSNAEREIVIWMMRGIVEETDIAHRLFRSPNTVRTHLNSIFRKLNVHSRHELIAKILRHGCEQN